MSDRNDVPCIIIEREGGGLGSFFLGAAIGAGLALLFAPKSGEETQRELKERALQLRDAAEDKVRAAQRSLEDRLDTARDSVKERVGAVRGAVEVGRKAAHEARGELERKLDRSKTAYRAGIEAAAQETLADSDEEAEEGEAQE